tara:strand:- start:11380 stop:11799 length:420 start_codon:yes stop_codon:yes gene_type:complete
MSRFGDKMRAKKEARFEKRQDKAIKKGKYLMSKEDKQKAKENRKTTRKHIKETTGKTGIEQAADKVKAKVEKAKKTKVGKTVKKVVDKVSKAKDTNVYKAYKGGKEAFSNLKKGKIGAAIKNIRDTTKSFNKKDKNKKG